MTDLMGLDDAGLRELLTANLKATGSWPYEFALNNTTDALLPFVRDLRNAARAEQRERAATYVSSFPCICKDHRQGHDSRCYKGIAAAIRAQGGEK